MCFTARHCNGEPSFNLLNIDYIKINKLIKELNKKSENLG